MIKIEFLRQFHFLGYSVFDLFVSFLGIYLIAPILSKIFLKFKLRIPKKNWLFLTLPIGIIFHLIFSQTTPMMLNFIDIHSHYMLKIIILTATFFGVKGIKRIK